MKSASLTFHHPTKKLLLLLHPEPGHHSFPPLPVSPSQARENEMLSPSLCLNTGDILHAFPRSASTSSSPSTSRCSRAAFKCPPEVLPVNAHKRGGKNNNNRLRLFSKPLIDKLEFRDKFICFKSAFMVYASYDKTDFLKH